MTQPYCMVAHCNGEDELDCRRARFNFYRRTSVAYMIYGEILCLCWQQAAEAWCFMAIRPSVNTSFMWHNISVDCS